MKNKVQLVKNSEENLFVLKLNDSVYYEGPAIPEMVWLELISDLGVFAMLKTVSNEEMKEGKY